MNLMTLFVIEVSQLRASASGSASQQRIARYLAGPNPWSSYHQTGSYEPSLGSPLHVLPY